MQSRSDIETWLSLRTYKSTIKLAASSRNLDAALLTAVLINESSGYAHASRFEPKFYRRYISGVSRERLRGHWPTWSLDADGEMKERLDRATSWGLGQIMGQTAREFGYKSSYLCHLCEPKQNIILSSDILAQKFKLASQVGSPDKTRAALLLYNGGSDLNYPDRVLSKIESAKRVLE